jgi:hypothetical protein
MNGWLVCAEEDESGVDLDSFIQKDATSVCLCESGDRSEKTCRRLWETIQQASSWRTLLHRFLECLQGGDSQREHHAAVGKAKGETSRAGALEEHAATTFGSVCAQNTLLFPHSCMMQGSHLFLLRYNLERATILEWTTTHNSFPRCLVHPNRDCDGITQVPLPSLALRGNSAPAVLLLLLSDRGEGVPAGVVLPCNGADCPGHARS